METNSNFDRLPAYISYATDIFWKTTEPTAILVGYRKISLSRLKYAAKLPPYFFGVFLVIIERCTILPNILSNSDNPPEKTGGKFF